MSILDRISCHDDLLALDDKQRQELCVEVRRFLVENVSKTGGHLASNLGVVELSVALETVFDTRTDRLVFDVGHQSYVHKILTGRQAEFANLRQFGGMAGFPKPGESVADAFVAGHASSSVSIALGMARARTLTNSDHHVIALIGDGATTGGLAYEGLNDAGVSGEPMIVILNDNKMSIDRNVGGMSQHLARLRTAKSYFTLKRRFTRLTEHLPGGQFLFRVAKKIKDTVKVQVIDGKKPFAVQLDQSGTVDVLLGTPLQLNATVIPETAETKLSYSSSNAKVARVDENGLVVGMKPGSATITVKTSNNKKDTVKVRVIDPDVVDVVYGEVITETGVLVSGTVCVSDVVYVSANVYPATAETSYSYTSSNKKVATIDKDGRITALKPGTVTIKIKTANGKTTSVKLKIVAKSVAE